MSTILSQCPSCSRLLNFSSSETHLVVCTCGTVARRTADGMVSEAITILQQPDGALQPGTNGTWQGKPFTLTGRIRTWYEEAVFNYWFIAFEDSSYGLLAAGYGMYAVLTPSQSRPALSPGYTKNLAIGGKRDIFHGVEGVLKKNYDCHQVEVEGEAWLPSSKKLSVLEWTAAGGYTCEMFDCSDDIIYAFDAVEVNLDELSLQQLRAVEDTSRSFTCSSCKELVIVKAYPYAQSCACHCGARYVLRHGAFAKINSRNDIDSAPAFPLGSTGAIDGVQYELVGYAIKEDNSAYCSQWREYTLYNTQGGFAFLSEYDGHWTFLQEKLSTPVVPKEHSKTIKFHREPYQLFNSYQYTVRHAVGAFPYNAFNNENTEVKEFISPPEIWIRELNGEEGIVWFHGKHIDAKSLGRAFTFPNGLPPKSGVGIVEPRFFLSPEKLVRMAIAGILFLVMLHLFTAASKRERPIYSETHNFADTAAIFSTVTPRFHLDRWRGNLQFDVTAPLNNDWFELNATVVNVATGAEYSIEKGVEFYSGYEEGEYWSEGDRSATAYITAIPAGDYIVQLQGIRNFNSLSPGVTYFNVRVTYDVSNHRNLWFSLLFLIIWPVVQYYRTTRAEKQRWYNSPYSPFTYED